MRSGGGGVIAWCCPNFIGHYLIAITITVPNEQFCIAGLSIRVRSILGCQLVNVRLVLVLVTVGLYRCCSDDRRCLVFDDAHYGVFAGGVRGGGGRRGRCIKINDTSHLLLLLQHMHVLQPIDSSRRDGRRIVERGIYGDGQGCG